MSAQHSTNAGALAQHVAPLLVRKCLECHGGDATDGGYDLRTLASLMQAGDSAAAPIVPSAPERSELLRRLVTDDESERMPSGGPALSSDEIAAVRNWIADGAPTDSFADDTPLLEIAVAGSPAGAAPVRYRRPLPVGAMAILRQPPRIVTGGYHELLLWNAVDGRLVDRWHGPAADGAAGTNGVAERRGEGDAPAGLGVYVAALAVDAAGSRLAVAHGTPGENGQVSLVRLDHQQPVQWSTVCTLPDVPAALAFDVQQRWLAIGDLDGDLHIVDLATGERTSSGPHADAILAVAWSDDGQFVMTASRDRTARVLQIDEGRSVTSYAAHERSVHGVGSTTEGVLTIDETGALRLWPLAGNKSLLQREDARQATLGLRAHGDVVLVPLVHQVMRTTVQSVPSPEKDDGEKSQAKKQKTVLKWKDQSPLEIDAQEWITSTAVDADGSVAVGTQGGRVYVWPDGADAAQPSAPVVFQATP